MIFQQNLHRHPADEQVILCATHVADGVRVTRLAILSLLIEKLSARDRSTWYLSVDVGKAALQAVEKVRGSCVRDHHKYTSVFYPHHARSIFLVTGCRAPFLILALKKPFFPDGISTRRKLLLTVIARGLPRDYNVLALEDRVGRPEPAEPKKQQAC